MSWEDKITHAFNAAVDGVIDGFNYLKTEIKKYVSKVDVLDKE